jgi:hypothetical protein
MRTCDHDIWVDTPQEQERVLCGKPGYAILTDVLGKPTVCKECFEALKHSHKPYDRDMVKEFIVISPERSAGMTVNQMIAMLHRLRSEGRGNQLVHISMDGRDWCPRLDRIKEHHTPAMGHVVLHGEKYSEEWDEAPKPAKPLDFVQRVKRRAKP